MRRPFTCRCKMVVVIFPKAFFLLRSRRKMFLCFLVNIFSDTELDVEMNAVEDVSFVPRERAGQRIPGWRMSFKWFLLSNEARQGFSLKCRPSHHDYSFNFSWQLCDPARFDVYCHFIYLLYVPLLETRLDRFYAHRQRRMSAWIFVRSS